MKGKILEIEERETRKGTPMQRINIRYKSLDDINPTTETFTHFGQLLPDIKKGIDVDFTFKTADSGDPLRPWLNITSIRKAEPVKEEVTTQKPIEAPQTEYTMEEKVNMMFKEISLMKDLLLKIAEKSEIDTGLKKASE